MSDLSSMIDATTERLLRKIDNWEVPQSDKKYVVIEKEVWESTLKASMDRAGKIETLQKQLEIAQEALDYYSDMRKYNKSGWCPTDVGYQKAWEASLKIQELNK